MGDEINSVSDNQEDGRGGMQIPGGEGAGVRKRDTHKIKTNPKYKCLDDGSDDENDEVKHEDYQQLSSKEIDFRETIIKQESKDFDFPF
jgi:hypothetical protein